MNHFKQIGVQQTLVDTLPRFAACSLNMLRLVLVMLFCGSLIACATSNSQMSSYKDTDGDEYVFHAFKFDATKDSPKAEVLDFRYGTAKNLGIRPSVYFRNLGKVEQSEGTTGRMLRGDVLYVKWKLKDTGKIYEDTIDLKSRLPRSIDKQTIYFIIDQEQLYVYLISFESVRAYLTKDEARADDDAIENKPYKNLGSYARNNLVQIYPSRIIIYPYQSK